jgi:hypothetical protein
LTQDAAVSAPVLYDFTIDRQRPVTQEDWDKTHRYANIYAGERHVLSALQRWSEAVVMGQIDAEKFYEAVHAFTSSAPTGEFLRDTPANSVK